MVPQPLVVLTVSLSVSWASPMGWFAKYNWTMDERLPANLQHPFGAQFDPFERLLAVRSQRHAERHAALMRPCGPVVSRPKRQRKLGHSRKRWGRVRISRKRVHLAAMIQLRDWPSCCRRRQWASHRGGRRKGVKLSSSYRSSSTGSGASSTADVCVSNCCH